LQYIELGVVVNDKDQSGGQQKSYQVCKQIAQPVSQDLHPIDVLDLPCPIFSVFDHGLDLRARTKTEPDAEIDRHYQRNHHNQNSAVELVHASVPQRY